MTSCPAGASWWTDQDGHRRRLPAVLGQRQSGRCAVTAPSLTPQAGGGASQSSCTTFLRVDSTTRASAPAWLSFEEWLEDYESSKFQRTPPRRCPKARPAATESARGPATGIRSTPGAPVVPSWCPGGALLVPWWCPPGALVAPSRCAGGAVLVRGVLRADAATSLPGSPGRAASNKGNPGLRSVRWAPHNRGGVGHLPGRDSG